VTIAVCAVPVLRMVFTHGQLPVQKTRIETSRDNRLLHNSLYGPTAIQLALLTILFFTISFIASQSDTQELRDIFESYIVLYGDTPIWCQLCITSKRERETSGVARCVGQPPPRPHRNTASWPSVESEIRKSLRSLTRSPRQLWFAIAPPRTSRRRRRRRRR